MVWMVRREQVAPVVLGKIHPELGKGGTGGQPGKMQQVQVLVIMGEWVRVGMRKGATEGFLAMESEVAHLLKVGLEVRLDE